MSAKLLSGIKTYCKDAVSLWCAINGEQDAVERHKIFS
jgi:hypothetical protein